jgi:hypothetical protein
MNDGFEDFGMDIRAVEEENSNILVDNFLKKY